LLILYIYASVHGISLVRIAKEFEMTLLEKLSINKKITAFFVDGTSKMNLGIGAVVDLLHGAERVPVQIAPVKRAERLLADLAESAGRTIQKVEDGTFLAVSPEPEPAVVEAPVEVAQPEPEVVAQPVATAPGVARKYPTLSKTFFNGSPQGQILSVYKTRESNPQKVADFKAALENGDCTWGDAPFSKAVVEKAAALGIEVPENLVAKSKASRIP
jgi:hypothetical protein